VYRNNTRLALTQFVRFCKDFNNVNIIILDIPHRYDLMETSCVNREIRIYNRKLRKFTKVFKHVSIIEMNNDRETFTSHGLHLNNLGNQQIAKQVANEIRRLIDKKVSNIIRLDWKQVSEETSPNRIIEQTDKGNQLRSDEMRNMGNSSTKVLRTSKRSKRPPLTMNNDSLC
jgi:hypothetical protein